MYEFKMATNEDIDEMVKLRMHEQYNCHHDWNLVTPELITETKKRLEEWLNKILFAFLIKKDGKIVATSCLMIQTYLPEIGNIPGIRGYLCNVYTIDEERRKGHQKYLANKIYEFARENHIVRIDLHANREEQVYEMYRNMGYDFVPNNGRLMIK